MKFILRRLKANHFKQLTDVNLTFPEKGAILIEGNNEAGKSTLFEAVYFALYGETHLEKPKDWNGKYDRELHLTKHGETEMAVDLEFSIGAHCFTIHRGFTLRKASWRSPVVFRYPGLGGKTLESTSLREANALILEHIGLSKEAMENSCFVAQKKLDSLDSVDPAERIKAINELLNLEIFTKLEAKFTPLPKAADPIPLQTARVEIARIDSVFPNLCAARDRAKRCRLYAQILQCEAKWNNREMEIDAAQIKISGLETQRKEIDDILAECDGLRRKINAIDSDLKHLAANWKSAEDAHKSQAAIVANLAELERARAAGESRPEMQELQNKLAAAKTAETAAEKQSREVNIRIALENWIAAAEQEAGSPVSPERLAEREAQKRDAEQARDAAEAQRKPAQTKRLIGIVCAIGGLVLAIIALLLKSAVLGVVGIGAGIIGAAVALAGHRAEQRAAAEAAEAGRNAQGLAGEIKQIQAHLDAEKAESGKSAALLRGCLAAIAALNEPAPENVAAARERIASLPALSRNDAEKIYREALLEFHRAKDAVENEEKRVADCLATLPTERKKLAEDAAKAKTNRDAFLEAWRSALSGELEPAAADDAESRLPEIRATLQSKLDALNENQQKQNLQRISAALRELEIKIGGWRNQQAEARKEQGVLLRELEIEPETAFKTPPKQFPELADVNASDTERLGESEREANRLLTANRADRKAKAGFHSVGDEPLDLEAEQDELEKLKTRRDVRTQGGAIVKKARETVVSQVMPATTHYINRLLPLLTDDRYNQVQWDEKSSKIAVYDSQARGFRSQSVFSGGAKDQISLALRLAFAMATLPGEHSVRPGWLFLDEPLSSFDRQRTLDLVKLLTNPKGLIRGQFDQIFLVSHSEAFDANLFDCRLRMESGRIVENSLPASG